MSTPLKAVRQRCLDCAGGATEVRKCTAENCELHAFRMGRDVRGKGSTLKAIRKYCLWCCLGKSSEVRLCPATNCSLHSYRSGRNPRKHGKPATPAQLAALAKGRAARARSRVDSGAE